MKVLVPYKIQNGVSIHDEVVSGGIEKFIKTLYSLLPEIVPVEITEDEVDQKKTKEVLLKAIKKEKPDMVLANYDGNVFFNYVMDLGIPVSLIVHSPVIRHIKYIETLKNIKKFTEKGGHLYFVSKNQHEFLNQMCVRLHGYTIDNVKGYINPAYAQSNFVPNENIEYDAVTVGRAEALKDPFWIHKKLKNTGKKSLVITNSGSYLKNKKHDVYYHQNLDWKEPQITKRDVKHSHVIEHVSKSSCYISTCPDESWGIGALEALCCGVPLIIATNKNGKHSSTEIAADPSHYRLVSKKIKSEDLVKIVDELSLLSYDKRLEISRMTREKHSEKNFIMQIKNLIHERVKDKLKVNSIESFFE